MPAISTIDAVVVTRQGRKGSAFNALIDSILSAEEYANKSGVHAVAAMLQRGRTYTSGLTHEAITTETGKTYPANVVASHVHRQIRNRVIAAYPELADKCVSKSKGAQGFIIPLAS